MGFFEDSYISAKSLFDTTVKKAGETIEVQKIRIEIAKIQSAITSAYSVLGEKYYEQLKCEEKDENAFDEIIAEIDLKKKLLEEQNAKLVEAKHNIICKNCGRVNSDDAKYCSGCGSELKD